MAALLLTACAACGPVEPFDAGTDAGSTDAPITPRRELLAEGSTTITLAPSAEVTLRLRLADERGAGVAGEVISFALAGAARSSTLRQLEAISEPDGAASVVLIAGPLPTTFQIRATAVGAPALLFDVSVGTEFGELEVTVRPEVTRPVTAYVLRAVADLPCAEVTSVAGGDERRIGTELPSTIFPALATGAAWTVEVRGESAAGRTVARGCVEGVRVAATASTRSTVDVRDLPLEAAGAYAVVVALAAGPLGTEARSGTLGTVLSDTGATLLLDGLRAELETRAVADVSALRVARAAGLDARLALELEAESTTLPSELDAIATEAELGFDGLALEATLRQGAVSVLEARQARIGAAIVAGPFEASLGTVAGSPMRDELTIAGVDVRVGAAALYVAALGERARARSADGLAGVIRDGYACGTMLLVVTRDRLLSSCDARCVREGCARAAANLEARMGEAATLLDVTHAAVRFDATIALADGDGDLRVDETTADGIPAHWESLDGSAGASVEARWSGVRDDALE